MNKFLLGVGAALMIAAGGISVASTANVAPHVSQSPTLRVKYELFGVKNTEVDKKNVEELIPLQSNTLVFTPINGQYTPSPEIKYWVSQPQYSTGGKERYTDANYGIKFILTPQKWDTHHTYVVNLNGTIGDGRSRDKEENITLDVTLNPGEQTTPLVPMFTIKTTVEEVQTQ